MPIYLNGFRIELSSSQLPAQEREVPDPAEMRVLRETYRDEWFLTWANGKALGLPRIASPAKVFGNAVMLDCNDHETLRLLTSRLNDALPASFPRYQAFRRRPFAFLGQRDELVGLITASWDDVPSLVREFKIRPRFELDPRLIEIHPEQTEIGLFLRVDLNWSIIASIDTLQAAGIDVTGLHVIRRNSSPEERRLVGKIGSVDGPQVILSEAFDDLESIPINQVYLEGSKASFARCLKGLLGPRYDDFESQRWIHEGKFLLGPSLNRLLGEMEKVLRKVSPIELTPGFTCELAGRIEIGNSAEYQALTVCDPVEYCFDAAKSKRHEIPWAGLTKFGPFDRDSFPKKTPRILVVCPDQVSGKVSQFIKAFRDGIQSIASSRYPKGFSSTFGLVNPQFVTCTVPVLGTPDRRAADAYRRAIEDHLAASREPYDVALVVILDHHASLPDAINPYLFGKAVLLMNGVPVQDVRVATLTARHESLQWSMQNLAVAMYAKMGGTPWTVAHDMTVDDELVIGMGSVELSGSRFEGRQRFMGITTVFRGDGNYLLSNISRSCTYDEYPAMLEATTAEVLREVKRRNGWQNEETVRVVFHIHKPLKKVEIARIVDRSVKDVSAAQTVQFAFLTVSHDHPFKVMDPAQAGKRTAQGMKAVFAPSRGTITQLGRFTRLLCTNGPNQIKRASAPLPSPLLIHLHRESTYRDLQYLSEQALKFTSLTWRSTQPAHAPVTIYYSELIASLLARLKAVPDWSPAVLNTKLRASRWFL